jgi:uncharacterized protein YecT (DUF1311 family)
MRPMFEKRFVWPVLFAATLLASCVSPVAMPRAQKNRARMEDNWDYLRVEKRLDEAYKEAVAGANAQERAILEKEHARWFVDRETRKNDPDTYIAYTEQEIRYFAGNYDEPSAEGPVPR